MIPYLLWKGQRYQWFILYNSGHSKSGLQQLEISWIPGFVFVLIRYIWNKHGISWHTLLSLLFSVSCHLLQVFCLPCLSIAVLTELRQCQTLRLLTAPPSTTLSSHWLEQGQPLPMNQTAKATGSPCTSCFPSVSLYGNWHTASGHCCQSELISTHHCIQFRHFQRT